MEVNRRIKLLRKVTGLKQKEFSEAIGISQGNLSDMERDKFKPSIDTIISISRYFCISTDWLLKGEGEGIDSVNYTNCLANKNVKLQSLREAADKEYTAVNDDEEEGNQLNTAIMHGVADLNQDEKIQVFQYINFLLFQRGEEK